MRRDRSRRPRRKVCSFCVDKVEHIDYKDVAKISRDCIDKKDMTSINNWYTRVNDHLDSYVLIPDANIKNRVLRYLLLNKRVKEINYNKYQLIYEGIYGKTRGK